MPALSEHVVKEGERFQKMFQLEDAKEPQHAENRRVKLHPCAQSQHLVSFLTVSTSGPLVQPPGGELSARPRWMRAGGAERGVVVPWFVVRCGVV